MSRKFAWVFVLQVALVLAVGACSSAESTQPAAPQPADSEATVVARSGPDGSASASPTAAGPPSDIVSQLIQRALRVEGSVSHGDLVQRLGSPQRVETRPVPNQYVQGQIDTVRTLVYPGVEALVYDVTGETKSFLVRLSLLSPRYATPEGLRVGIVEGEVLEKIGPPMRRDRASGELIYQETETPATSLVVRVQNNRVVRIDWEFSFT
jgi:hypothetical protein